MSDFAMVTGFEDVWRPPVRTRLRRPETVLSASRSSGAEPRARLARIVERAPEVMVKVTGRTRDGDHLRAHLTYISRRGALEMYGSQGEIIARSWLRTRPSRPAVDRSTGRCHSGAAPGAAYP